ncbi:HNH endonuclease signature motif containing protein [Streptomyces sp. SID2119]|uniref:HNH endonuclease n=1 Tax=Streptomyces sp. SID2119 TaxID=2690253 RepID=UPI001927E755
MTPRRLSVPTAQRMTAVDRAVAGKRPSAVRSARRPCPIGPPLRAVEPPSGPSRRDVLRRWEELEWWSCVYCDAPFGPMVVAEVDHVTPLARGGVHEWFNLAPACARCNRVKGDRDMSDWLHVLAGQLDTEREVTATERDLLPARHVHTPIT